MSERFKVEENVHESKATRLPIAEEFSHYRFGRDALAHVSRYLLVVEKIIEMAKTKKRPISWIDLGCGNIYLPRVLAASFRVKKEGVVARYVGIDIDGQSMKRASQTKPKCFPIELEVGDITDGALSRFKAQDFDLLTCLEVVEHLKPELVPIMLKEIKRLARIAMISTPNYAAGSGKLPQDHVKEWSVRELAAAIAESGLVIKEKIGIFSNLPNVERLAKQSPRLAGIYNFLKGKMDKNFLSIMMARFVGDGAQNILYICG